ncbi:hypothetical protein CL3_00700 [butyrate-producing bacterium SM4/1]|nr:hypothetical protein CL3_00700 [butyrate-producing bacterium SM4/1]
MRSRTAAEGRAKSEAVGQVHKKNLLLFYTKTGT